MNADLVKLLRAVAAFVVVAVACPVALIGGAHLGCATQGFTADCAVTGALWSPFFLVGAGVVAGLIVRGWTGLGIVLVGVVAGMVSIPQLAAAAGNSVPIDPWLAIFATFWFVTPVVIGYVVGRAISRYAARHRRTGRA